MWNWKLGYSNQIDVLPEEWVSAYVPSDVQLVWQKEKNMPDYNYGKNYLDYKWMEDQFWHYATDLYVAAKEDFIPMLLLKGIDYAYTIKINDKDVVTDEGMFTPVKLNLYAYRDQTIQIEIILHPIPKVAGMPDDRTQAAQSCKPPVSYGWDWHPRLVPSGLYDEVELVYVPSSHITEQDFLYTVADDLSNVDFLSKISICNPCGIVTAQMIDATGEIVAEAQKEATSYVEIPLFIENPHLWWCIRHGEQYRYTYNVQLTDESGTILQQLERKIGFRRIQLVMNEGSWNHAVMGSFPVTQAYCPITIELNNRRIFGKGSNYVPPEIFYSRMTYDVYYETLKLVRDCNMNLIRMWGGGLVNKDCFFDICDEMGIMVWQEFPLACNIYPDQPHYLKVLEKESISIIQRLKSHPSVVLWCGGNELFCSWSGMTNQSLALRLLDKNCLEYDPKTPYIMTSPLFGIGHGHYLLKSAPNREVLSDFIDNFRTAYTEFGTPSPSPFEYCKKFIPKEEWYTIEEGTAWEHHHALNAWCDRNTWFRPADIESYCGKTDTLEETINNGILIQGEGYKGIFEEARRKWPATSMALNWCFNEPWPTAANNSLVLYPAIPKAAYYEVQKALRDQMISIKLYKLIWKKGELLEGELFVLNDQPEELKGCSMKIFIRYPASSHSKEDVEIGTFAFDQVPASSSTPIGKFAYRIPEDSSKKFAIHLEAENTALNSSYVIFCP